jgi:hypothetical protein
VAGGAGAGSGAEGAGVDETTAELEVREGFDAFDADEAAGSVLGSMRTSAWIDVAQSAEPVVPLDISDQNEHSDFCGERTEIII